MKKSLFTLLLSAPLLLAACGGTPAAESSSAAPESKSEETPATSAPAGYKYTATIKQSSGEKISGVKAQWCIGEKCLTPVACDDNGYAEMYSEEEGPFNVHAMGYDKKTLAYNPYGYVATPSNPDVTINMTDVLDSSVEHTTNTADTALEVSEGAYRITLKQDEVYYISLTATASAKYSLESWQSDLNSGMKIEYTGDKADLAKAGETTENNNFKYEFTAEAATYTFAITLTANPYNATGKAYTFPIAVLKA